MSILGVDLIREALLTAKKEVNNEDWEVSFKVVAPPLYQAEVLTKKREEGVTKLQEALNIVKKVMQKHKEKFSLKMPPRVVQN